MLPVTRRFGQLAIAAVLLTATASAQTSTGGLRGFVKDPSGAVLIGATVEASSRARIGGPAVEVTPQFLTDLRERVRGRRNGAA